MKAVNVIYHLPSPSDELTATKSNPMVRLTPLTDSQPRFHFGTLFLAELRLLLYRLPWWWYLVAVGLIAASFFLPLETLRQNILPAALVWPLLVWSGLGCRETRSDTRQMVFSAPRRCGIKSRSPGWLVSWLQS
ncbi:MAG: hypothetical protein ACOYYS_23265 [Chloroflexota bacterium]